MAANITGANLLEQPPRWLVPHEFPGDGGGVSRGKKGEVAPGLDERLHACILGKRLGTKLFVTRATRL